MSTKTVYVCDCCKSEFSVYIEDSIEIWKKGDSSTSVDTCSDCLESIIVFIKNLSEPKEKKKKTHLSDLGLSTKNYNALTIDGDVLFVEDLHNHNKKSLLKIRMIGERAISELIFKLNENGFRDIACKFKEYKGAKL